MQRTILVHLTVSVPGGCRLAPSTIVKKILKGLDGDPRYAGFELVADWEIDEAPAVIYTVHPFDDEWVWDNERTGSHPWVTPSLQEAIDHANLVRLEYASIPDVDPEWIASFWSAIYEDTPGDDSTRENTMVGYVDPFGNYNEGDDPPLDEHSGWAGHGRR